VNHQSNEPVEPLRETAVKFVISIVWNVVLCCDCRSFI